MKKLFFLMVIMITFPLIGMTQAEGDDEWTVLEKPKFPYTHPKITALRQQPVSMYGISYVSQGALLAAACDNVIKLWDFRSGKIEKQYHEPAGIIFSVNTSDNFIISTAGLEMPIVRKWDMATDKSQEITIDQMSVTNAASSDGLSLLRADILTQAVSIWRLDWLLKTAVCVKTFNRHNNDLPLSIAFSPDEQKCVFAGEGKVVKILNTGDEKEHKIKLKHNDSAIVAIALSPQGNNLVTGPRNDDGSIDQLKIWDITSKSVIQTIPKKSAITALAYSLDGKTLAYADAGDSELITLFDLETGHTEKISLQD